MIARKNIILFDDGQVDHLLPLTYTRPACELRVGILTIAEKWENYLDGMVSYITKEYLSSKFPIKITDDNLFINGRLLPNEKMVRLIRNLGLNEAILYEDELVAARMDRKKLNRIIDEDDPGQLSGTDITTLEGVVDFIHRPNDIFQKNDQEIRKDFELVTAGRKSQIIPREVSTKGFKIFVEPGAEIDLCRLNSSTGPIYIGKDAKILDASVIRGPFALCEGAVVKMSAKIYGATTVGPYSKVGGEIKNVVIQANSNKSHDGYLGNAVLGEWCNLGADTNSSNLKNNYAEVKIWDYVHQKFSPTGSQFCGLIMGDHSKCGINTMFNTGTVVGVSCNIYGSGFPRTFIPSFSWGGASGYMTYRLDKAFETMEKVYERKAINFTQDDKNILEKIFNDSAEYRSWEK